MSKGTHLKSSLLMDFLKYCSLGVITVEFRFLVGHLPSMAVAF